MYDDDDDDDEIKPNMSTQSSCEWMQSDDSKRFKIDFTESYYETLDSFF